MEAAQEHILLLGDSVIDNQRYVPRGPAVAQQLRDAISARGETWRVTQRALDGAVMADVHENQLFGLPADASLIVLSVGGNDGLQFMNQLSNSLWHLTKMWEFLVNFERQYDALVTRIRTAHVSIGLVVCTIYQPQFKHWGPAALGNIGVPLLNRIIRRVAVKHQVPLIDLWAIFTRPEDYGDPNDPGVPAYSSAIEPGVPGGAKIVRNIMALITSGHHNQPLAYREYNDASSV